jgi:hypothetical protein
MNQREFEQSRKWMVLTLENGHFDHYETVIDWTYVNKYLANIDGERSESERSACRGQKLTEHDGTMDKERIYGTIWIDFEVIRTEKCYSKGMRQSRSRDIEVILCWRQVKKRSLS